MKKILVNTTLLLSTSSLKGLKNDLKPGQYRFVVNEGRKYSPNDGGDVKEFQQELKYSGLDASESIARGILENLNHKRRKAMKPAKIITLSKRREGRPIAALGIESRYDA